MGEAGAGAVNADREWAAFAEKRGAELLSLRGELDTDLVDGRRFDKGYREGLRQGDVQRALDIAARAADGDPGAAGQPSSMRSGKSVYAMLLHADVVESARRYGGDSASAQEEAYQGAKEAGERAALAAYGALVLGVLALWHPLGALQGTATAGGCAWALRIAAAPMLEQVSMLFAMASNRGGARPRDEEPPRYRRRTRD